MSESISNLMAATDFAAAKHRDQRRKDALASPYINHPIAVANVLANQGGVTEIDLIVAAILHDTVEDTETSNDEISTLFGTQVARIVAEVTDDKSLPKAERKQLQVDLTPHKSDHAKQLKIADKICNIRDIDQESPADWDIKRKAEYLEWAARVVEGCRGINLRLDNLFDRELAAAQART